MSKNITDIILSAYEKFNARDIDDALALMEPDVEGELISETIVHHVFSFRNEKIASMRIQGSNDRSLPDATHSGLELPRDLNS